MEEVGDKNDKSAIQINWKVCGEWEVRILRVNGSKGGRGPPEWRVYVLMMLLMVVTQGMTVNSWDTLISMSSDRGG